MIVLIIACDYILIFYTKRFKISIGILIIFTIKSDFLIKLLCKIHIFNKYFLCKEKICKMKREKTNKSLTFAKKCDIL